MSKEDSYMNKKFISKFFGVPKEAIAESRSAVFKYKRVTPLPECSWKKADK